jgi:hypothetical protein
MGGYSVAVGQALSDVLAGREGPAFLSCGDARADLRATPAAEKAKFATLGPSPTLVMVGLKVSLSALAKDGTDPGLIEGARTSGPPSAFIDARSLVGPNGKVTWVELTGQLSGFRMPLDNRISVTQLVAPLGPDLAAFASGLASGCNVALLTESDLDALPYEVQKDERDTILVGMKRVSLGLPQACRAAAQVDKPWEVHFHHADAVFRGAGHMARVRARMHVEGNAPCLGPIEIEQVIAGG